MEWENKALFPSPIKSHPKETGYTIWSDGDPVRSITDRGLRQLFILGITIGIPVCVVGGGAVCWWLSLSK